MENLKIEKSTAKKLYAESQDWFKTVLEETFGEECFRKTSFTDLKTFDDLCHACGTTEAEFEAKLKELPISQTLRTVAKFELLSEGINQGWRPDTLDTSQKKWLPVFTVSSSGLDFSGSSCNFDCAYATVGFPFCFESEAKSDHAGKQFIKLWEELILRKIE